MQSLLKPKVTGLSTKLRHQRRKRVPRWSFVMYIGVLIASIAFISFRSHKTALADSNCTQGATLNIVAHQDDDLLFLNPDVLHAIQADRCVRTIFVTSKTKGNVIDRESVPFVAPCPSPLPWRKKRMGLFSEQN